MFVLLKILFRIYFVIVCFRLNHFSSVSFPAQHNKRHTPQHLFMPLITSFSYSFLNFVFVFLVAVFFYFLLFNQIHFSWKFITSLTSASTSLLNENHSSTKVLVVDVIRLQPNAQSYPKSSNKIVYHSFV